MAWEFTPYSVPPLVAAIIAAAVAGETWRHRREPGAWSFLALMLLLVGWSLAYAIQLGFTTLDAQLFWLRVGLCLGACVPPVWVVFAVRYAGLERYLSPEAGGMLAADPVAFAVLIWTNERHGTIFADASMAGPVASVDLGVGYLVHITFAYALVTLGIGIIAWVAANATSVHRKQAAVLVAAAVVPFAANVAFTLGVSPVPELDLTTFAFAVTGALMALALFRLDLLDIGPVARRHWIDQLGDGVVVVDTEGTVLEANDVAHRVLDPPPTPGSSVADSLSTGDPTTVDDAVVSATVDGGKRHYDLRRAELRDHHGRPAGTVVGLRDVTDRVEYEQRLEVANRVLRHNFRNAMNVVLGRAEELATSLPESDAEHARAIERRAREVIGLNEEIQQVATTLDRRAGTPSAVDAAAVVRDVVAENRTAYPDASFDLTASDPATVHVADADLLATAVGNLVENAAEHNDAPDPHVDVTVERDGSRVEIAVADDGPGIPRTEREVIESGEETPLQHGSGLGLWLVSWVVSAADGELHFAENHPRGSVVTIALPAVDAADSAATDRAEADD